MEGNKLYPLETNQIFVLSYNSQSLEGFKFSCCLFEKSKKLKEKTKQTI